MTNTEIIQAIRNEIERLKAINQNIKCETNGIYCSGYDDAFYDLVSFLSTLEEEDVFPCWKKVHTYTEKIHEGDMEKMLLDLSVGKGEKRTKIALPDRIVDILESEKPMNQDEELNDEIKKEMAKLPFFIRGKDLIAFARHFAQWGTKHANK